MGKAAQLLRALRRREFLVSFWGTFLTVLALPSALLQILGAHWSIELTIVLVVSALIFSLVFHRRQLIKSPMPSALDLILNGHTYIHCPCGGRLADEAKVLAGESYPPGAIAPDRFEQLLLKNPQILACLTDDHGTLLGYFDVLPLRPQFAELFLRGIVTEEQITHEDVIAPDEIESCEYLFISGLAVQDPDTQTGRVSASMLVWGILQYIEHFYGSSRALVFAIASTDAGEELLRRFKFAVRSGADLRLDRFTLYGLRLSREELERRLQCVPDWSPSCGLSWRQTPGGARRPRKRRAAPARRRAYELPPLSPEAA